MQGVEKRRWLRQNINVLILNIIELAIINWFVSNSREVFAAFSSHSDRCWYTTEQSSQKAGQKLFFYFHDTVQEPVTLS